MEMTVLGSSSHGNCYIMQNEQEALIIEAGIGLREVKKALQWNIAKVKGCIITHRHNDHAAHAPEYEKAGITILALQDVIEAKKLGRHAHPITAGNGYRLGNFQIMPFEVMHDTPIVAYLISHPEAGRTIFATDTYVLGHKMENGQMHLATFKDINHWMIETNYTTWIVDRNINHGNLSQAMKNRLLVSHMSLGNAIKTLLRHDLRPAREILLIHLSDGNSDEKMFIKRVRDKTGKRVIAAKPYLTINYNKEILK